MSNSSAKHLPPFSPQGRISDAVIAQVQAKLRSMTPAQARQHMIKVGIIDKKGNRLETPVASNQ